MTIFINQFKGMFFKSKYIGVWLMSMTSSEKECDICRTESIADKSFIICLYEFNRLVNKSFVE